jgi:hypothetical protein
MKYLIAALPIATLVACGGGGGGGGASYPNPGQTTFDPTTADTTITQNGTTYQFSGYINPNTNAPFTYGPANIAYLEDGNGNDVGYAYSSSNVTAAFGGDSNGLVFGLTGTPTAHSQVATGGTAIYDVAIDGVNFTADRHDLDFDYLFATADFGAGTFTGGDPVNNMISFDGTINGANIQGNVNIHVTSSSWGGPLVDGSGTFTGGFYGTNEVAGVWTANGNNGDQMGGVFYGFE